MTTCYIEEKLGGEKQSECKIGCENEKRNFGRATLMKNKRKWWMAKLRNGKEADGTVRKRDTKIIRRQFFWASGCEIIYHTILCRIFSNFGQFFANSWLRNGNPVNWTVLSLKVRFVNIRYWFTKFFDLPQNWPKIFIIEQISIMCSHFFSYLRSIFCYVAIMD